MAGFGAGFAKAVSGSLEAAGKLHQEEQLREREYQRARADKQADRAQDRLWQLEDRAAAEELTRKHQEAQFKTNIENYSMDKDGNLLYTSPLTGEVKPASKDSPMMYSWMRRAARDQQEDTRFTMDVERHRSGLATDAAQREASRESVQTSRHARTTGANAVYGATYKRLGLANKSLVDSMALGDATYITLDGGKQLKITPEMRQHARNLQELDGAEAVAALKALDPVLKAAIKITPKK